MSGIPHDHYEPKGATEKWIEGRLPILGLIHSTLFIPTPRRPGILSEGSPDSVRRSHHRSGVTL